MYLFTSEKAEQIVLKREEKSGSTGISLTARTSAELIVNAAAFMSLGSEYIQSARFNYLLSLGTYLLFKIMKNIIVLLAHCKNFFVVRFKIACGVVNLLGCKTEFLHLSFREILSVTAKRNIGTTAGHVG